MKSITVIALDDHYLVREGIRSLLAGEPDIKLMGEGTAGEHLEPLVQEHQPDVILLDLSMPQQEEVNDQAESDFRALPAIARLRRQYPGMHIIIVSQYISQAIIEGALELDVKGYLLKNDVLSLHLADAIRAVYRGGLYFSSGARERLGSTQSGESILTPRQTEIIQALAGNPGLSQAQHAQQLGISEHTFSNHLRQIFNRLEATNMLEAVVKATRRGIISFDQLIDKHAGPP